MAPIDLVVTDLDGTLWDRNERIHDRTLAALRWLESASVPVLVATGRRLRSARTRLEADGLHLPVVALDGALGHDGRCVFHERTFSTAAALALLDRLDEIGVSPCLYVDHPAADVVVGPDPTTHPAHQRLLAETSVRDDPRRVVADHSVYAIGVYGVEGARGRALAELAQHLIDHYAVQSGPDGYFGGHSLVAYPTGVNKWDGVQAFCAHTGLDDSRVLAVGDGPNDLELLAGARIACVVEDGCAPALALADEIIDPASAGGWARILELLPSA